MVIDRFGILDTSGFEGFMACSPGREL